MQDKACPTACLLVAPPRPPSARAVAFRWLNRARYGFTGGDLSWFAQVVGINALIQLGSSSVDGWAHLGGALGGAAVAALFGPRPGRW